MFCLLAITIQILDDLLLLLDLLRFCGFDIYLSLVAAVLRQGRLASVPCHNVLRR